MNEEQGRLPARPPIYSGTLPSSITYEQEAKQLVANPDILYSPAALRKLIAELLLVLEKERSFNTAAIAEYDQGYWRELVHNIGVIIGGDAYLCDDGTKSYEPLPAKLPGLVTQILIDNARYQDALKFYANQKHLSGFDSPVLGFDSVSGEPSNWLVPCVADQLEFGIKILDAVNELMVEDGGIAREVLAGGLIVDHVDNVIDEPATEVLPL